MPLRFSPAPGAGTISLQAASLSATQAAVSAAAAVVSATAAAASATAAAASAAIGRTRLAADRTYYVRTNGNDANTGLADTAIGAFLTLQHSWDVIARTLDLAGQYTVTVRVADGTYAGGLTTGPLPPGCATTQSIIFQGNTTTPANCLISTAGNCVTHGDAYSGAERGGITIKGFKLTSTGGTGIFTTGNLNFENMNFGTCGINQIYGAHNAFIITSTAYAVSGNAVFHALGQTGAILGLHASTVTFSNAPVFFAYMQAQSDSQIFHNPTFVNGNTVTGTRFIATTGGKFFVDGLNNITFYPGNAAGSASTGGAYDNIPPDHTLSVSGGIVDANYTATAADALIEVLTLSATRTINLPSAATFSNGRVLTVVDIAGAASAIKKVTATPNGIDLINGANAPIDLIAVAYGSAQLMSAGGSWIKLR